MRTIDMIAIVSFFIITVIGMSLMIGHVADKVDQVIKTQSEMIFKIDALDRS